MKRVSILIAITLAAFTAAIAQPKSLKNFDELMAAMNAGYNVRVVIHYGKCKLVSDNEVQDKSPDAIGGMTIDTYEYFAPKAIRGNENAFVVFSENKLIQNPKGKGFIYNYAKFRVESSGKVKVTVMYLDPNSQEELMSENFFTQFDDSTKEQAIFFYQQ
jgi:hypothetical protein